MENRRKQQEPMLRNVHSLVAGSFLLLCVSSGLHSQSMTPDSSGCLPSIEDCSQNQQEQQWPQGQQGRPNLQFPNQGMSPGTDLRTGKSLGIQVDSSPLTSTYPLPGLRLDRFTQLLPPDRPTEFQRYVAASTGEMLPIFGAELFRRVPSTFSPNNLAPATPNYVIQTDDELRIRIWGQVTYNGTLQVDRSGNIYIPQVGVIHVAGQPFSSLDVHLREAIGRIFRNFDVAVDLGRIRSMQIYVAGQARRPGAYTVSAFTTLVDALFASGGPSLQGSMRQVELKRAGKTIANFDMYELLVHGDKSHDIQLLPEDVIYIPAAGPQVAIFGSIRTAGIYELREQDTVSNLIDFAGKTSSLASATRLSIARIAEQRSYAMEVALDKMGLTTPLKDGDIVRIFPVVPSYKKTVTLRGNVADPGHFAWHEGMRLSELIPDRTSLQTRNYWWKRNSLGLPTPEFEPIINPNSTSPLAGGSTYPQAGGATYPPAGDSMYPQAGDSTYPQTGYPGDDGSSNMLQPQSGAPAENSNGVPPQPENKMRGNSIASAASGPSRGDSNRIRNIVSLTTPEINWKFAVIERTDPVTFKTSLVPFDLGKLVNEHDPSQDLALQPGDIITIFSKSDITVPTGQQTKYIHLDGEIAQAGVYSVGPEETLRDVVQRAGGLTSDAYLYGSEFTRESTRILQQQRFDDYLQSVREETARNTQQLALSGSSASTATQNASASREANQQLLARLSEIRATGRIVLSFKPESQALADIPALTLENGDHFTVPSIPATVNIVGSVSNQSSFLYQKNKTVGQYLKLAGGYNRNADQGRSFIIRADGTVIGRHSMDNTFNFLDHNSFDQLRLYPGDTIVIPEKPIRPSKLRDFIDWTTIFSQLAVGAAVVNSL